MSHNDYHIGESKNLSSFFGFAGLDQQCAPQIGLDQYRRVVLKPHHCGSQLTATNSRSHPFWSFQIPCRCNNRDQIQII